MARGAVVRIPVDSVLLLAPPPNPPADQLILRCPRIADNPTRPRLRSTQAGGAPILKDIRVVFLPYLRRRHNTTLTPDALIQVCDDEISLFILPRKQLRGNGLWHIPDNSVGVLRFGILNLEVKNEAITAVPKKRVKNWIPF